MALKFSYGTDHFVAGLGGGPGRPPGSKSTEGIPWESHLLTRKCCKKHGSDDSPTQNPVFLHVVSRPCFQNPIFCLHFDKNLQPGRWSRQALARPNQARTTVKIQGFGKRLIKVLVKTRVLRRQSAQTLFFAVYSCPQLDVAMILAKMHMKVSVFYEETTKLPKIGAKRSVKIQGFVKIMKIYSSKTLYFTSHSATRCLTHSQNTMNSRS